MLVYEIGPIAALVKFLHLNYLGQSGAPDWYVTSKLLWFMLLIMVLTILAVAHIVDHINQVTL